MSTALKHKRTYRACLNCRVRKVKCDLGSADSPREGKCLRCIRERKDCVFVESRRGNHDLLSGRLVEVLSGGDSSELEGSSQPSNLNRISALMNHDQLQSRTHAHGQPSQNPSHNYGHTSRNHMHNQMQSLNTSQGNSDNQPHMHNHTHNHTHNHNHNHHNHNSNSSNSSKNSSNLQDAGIMGSKNEMPKLNDSNKQNLTHFLTMEGALVFLANAAGTIAKADERDNIDAQQKHLEIEASLSSPASDRNFQKSNDDGSRKGLYSSQTEGSVDSDKVISGQKLNGSLSKLLNPKSNSSESLSSNSNPNSKTYHRRRYMPPLEKQDHLRPKAATKLSNYEYIGAPNGIMTEYEAETLINLFFTTMHPYFPYIPSCLQLPKVLAGYPILLSAILTISLRFHPFEDNVSHKGVARNIEVHDTLWLYVQRLISQTVWAEASTRSIGTILAFLLLTEWNPRAIHWKWIDYANKAEDGKDEQESRGLSSKSSGGNESEVNIAGIGAMRRSFRMGWMLIGSAIRLAQDMDFIDTIPSTFLACHVAEINSVMNISRRLMLSHSLSELDIDDEEHFADESKQDSFELQILTLKEEDYKKLAVTNVLKFTTIQRAKIELLQITCLAHETFYGYRAQLGALSQRQNLAALSLMSPSLKNWGRKYSELLVPFKSKYIHTNVANESARSYLKDKNSKESIEISECITHESLIFEYNYTKLYVYSLALTPSPNGKQMSRSLKMEEVSKAARFIEQAFSAANEMLSVAHRIHKLRVLLYMPVRWVTRIVRAIAFVVKCYLTINKNPSNAAASAASMSLEVNFDSQVLTLSLISVEEIMRIIQKAAITLRECSPDELHLATRYSNVLMYLCSEMKGTKVRKYDDEDVPQQPKKRTKFNSDTEFGKPYSENVKLPDIPTERGNPYTQFREDRPERPQLKINQFMQQQTGDQLRTDQTSSRNYMQPPADVVNETLYYELVYNHSNTSSISMSPQITSSSGSVIPAENELMDWFAKNKDIGLDFVAPWTEMIEQQLDSKDFNFDDALL